MEKRLFYKHEKVAVQQHVNKSTAEGGAHGVFAISLPVWESSVHTRQEGIIAGLSFAFTIGTFQGWTWRLDGNQNHSI